MVGPHAHVTPGPLWPLGPEDGQGNGQGEADPLDTEAHGVVKLKLARQVTVGELEDNTPFRMVIWGYLRPRSNEIVAIGYQYGVKLYTAGESRARVQWVGKREDNLPVSIPVEPVTPEMGSDEGPQEGRQMATKTDAVEEVVNAKARALQARYTFQHQQVAKAVAAGDVDKIEMAEKRVADIAAEAATLGVELVEPEIDEDGNVDAAATQSKVNVKIGKVTVGKGTPGADPEMEQTMASKKATGTAKAAEVKETRKAALAAASKAAGVPAKVKIAKVKAEPKVKVVREKKLPATQDCLCGCGQETGGKFRPGHDAKVKGMLYKVERGEAKVTELPLVLQAVVKFAGRAATAGKDGSDYRIVQAPVKFPGRDEIKVV